MKIFYKIIFLPLLIISSLAQAIVIVPKAPNLDVSSYVLLDADTGTIIASIDETTTIKPASITKLMTAYAAFQAIKEEQVRMDDPVKISERASSIGGSTMFLNPYMDVTIEDLLKGMIIVSGNDASVALAEHLAGSEETFAEYMNMYAEALGLNNTNYTNASGLEDDDHYSSAIDIAILASRIINEFPEYFNLYSERSYSFDQAKDPTTKEPIVQYNRNRLLRRDASIDGMKTGYTSSAGYCLVATAKKNSMRLIAVVTGAKSNEDRSSLNLLEIEKSSILEDAKYFPHSFQSQSTWYCFIKFFTTFIPRSYSFTFVL